MRRRRVVQRVKMLATYRFIIAVTDRNLRARANNIAVCIKPQMMRCQVHTPRNLAC